MKSGSLGKIVLLVLAFILAYLVIAHLKEKQPDDHGDPVTKLKGPVRGLFLIGNDRGMIRPCGCAKPVLGGVLRRQQFFKSRPEEFKDDGLVLAFGDTIITAGRQQELKQDAMIASFEAMGVKAFCLGEGELQLGSYYWENRLAQAENAKTALINLNVQTQGAPLFKTFLELEWQGQPLFVTGYIKPLDPTALDGALEILETPDLTPLLKVAKQRAMEAEKPLLLFYASGDPAAAREFLRQNTLDVFDRVLIVQSSVSDIPVVSSHENKTLVIEMGQKGRDIACIDWPRSSVLTNVTLDASWAPPEEVQKDPHSILNDYRRLVREESLLDLVPRFESSESHYTGSKACGACHEEAYKIWTQTGHARAWAALEKHHDTHDPECVGCHVVDFDRLGGYQNGDQQMVNVQCEACHGPGGAHESDPQANPTPRGKLGESFCYRCHDLANSPQFDFERYWPVIQHTGR